MFIWPIVQNCIIIMIAVLGVAQLVIPAVTGKRLFWLFRKDSPDRELAEANEDLSDILTRNKVGEIRDKIKDLTNKE